MAAFVCSRCREVVAHPADRIEVKVEALRAKSHDRRFKSRIIGYIGRCCLDKVWPEFVRDQEQSMQEALSL